MRDSSKKHKKDCSDHNCGIAHKLVKGQIEKISRILHPGGWVLEGESNGQEEIEMANKISIWRHRGKKPSSKNMNAFN